MAEEDIILNYLNNFNNIEDMENEWINLELNNNKLTYEIENNASYLDNNKNDILENLNNINQLIDKYSPESEKELKLNKDLVNELKSKQDIENNLNLFLKDLNRLSILLNDEYYLGAILNEYNFESFYNYILKHKKILNIIYLNGIEHNLSYTIDNINKIINLIESEYFENYIKNKFYIKLYEIFVIINKEKVFWEKFIKCYINYNSSELDNLNLNNLNNNIEYWIENYNEHINEFFGNITSLNEEFNFENYNFEYYLKKLTKIFFKNNSIDYLKLNISQLNDIIKSLKNKKYYKIIAKYILYPYFKYNKIIKYTDYNMIQIFGNDYIWIKINSLNILNDDFISFLDKFNNIKHDIYKDDGIVKSYNKFNSLNIKEFLVNLKSNNLKYIKDFNFNYFKEDILYDIGLFEKLIELLKDIFIYFKKLNSLYIYEFKIVETDSWIIEIINKKIIKKYISIEDLKEKFKSKYNCFNLNLELIIFEIFSILTYIKFNDILNLNEISFDDTYKINNELEIFKMEFEEDIFNDEAIEYNIVSQVYKNIYNFDIGDNENYILKFFINSFKINLFFIFYLKGIKNLNEFGNYILE